MPVGYLPASKSVTGSVSSASPIAAFSPNSLTPAALTGANNRSPIVPQLPTSSNPIQGQQTSTAYTQPPPAPPPVQDPGNNMINPGYTEQGANVVQNRLLEDPNRLFQQWLASQAQSPTGGEEWLNGNLGTLQGPGNGQQYWNQQSGQFNDPFAGEQFTREATQNYSPTGPAGAFFGQAMGQYGDFTGYSGPQAAAGQYGANAASGPLAGQQFYDQVGGSYGDVGRYSDPNLAAGQYAQTQQAFGDLPIANFDPFYDRARQLATQSYNQNAAGRGVYGSSEALSGVGNVITDIEAQRANRSFDAEMQRAQEQRMRQGLLGEQARMGDLSSLAAFGANLSGLETFGNLARTAGDQTLGQQRMLGEQANNVDMRAQDAQNSNIRGLEAFGTLSNNADVSERDRYRDSTAAMRDADRTQIDRVRAGADIADMADDNERADFEATANAATSGANVRNNRLQTGENIATGGSQADLSRLTSFMESMNLAEDDRQKRQESYMNASAENQRIIQGMFSSGMAGAFAQDQKAFEDYFESAIAPAKQAAGMSAEEIAAEKEILWSIIRGGKETAENVTEDDD